MLQSYFFQDEPGSLHQLNLRNVDRDLRILTVENYALPFETILVNASPVAWACLENQVP